MADIDLRKLERAFRAGDTSALAPYIAECKRTGITPDHGLAIAYFLTILRAVDQDEDVPFAQIGSWVIEALSLNVALLTDSDLQDYSGEDRTDVKEWFIMPTPSELKTLKNEHSRRFWIRHEWSPALLLYYSEESGRRENVFAIPDLWHVQPRFIKIDFVNTYSDIMEKALNPPHMCYGNCGCRACIIHGCCERTY